MKRSLLRVGDAWVRMQPARDGNGRTDGRTVWLFGNPILRWIPAQTWTDTRMPILSLAGWDTATTRGWINGILRLDPQWHEVQLERKGGFTFLRGRLLAGSHWYRPDGERWPGADAPGPH